MLCGTREHAPRALRRLTGVRVRDGRIVVRFPLWDNAAFPAVEGDVSSVSGDDAPEPADSPDSAGTDDDEPARRSLRDTAKSIGHLLTHKPAMPDHCEAC